MKKQPKRIVLTDEKVRDIEARLQINPQKSLKTLSTGTRVIASIAMYELQKVLHNLFMRCEACLQAEGGQFQHLL
jgi:hypothetical protein